MGRSNISRDNLEWIRDKAEKIYGKKQPTFQADKISQTELKVLQLILMNRKRGVSHLEAAKIIGLNRKNLTPYMKRLIAKKLIWREAGRQGKYFLTEEAYTDTRVSADIFGRGFRFKLLGEDNLITTNKISYSVPSKFTQKDIFEHMLFEFVNKVGGFIIFTVMQAMNPKNNHIISSKENIEKDVLIQEWIKNAILPVIPFLAIEFRNSVYKILRKYKGHRAQARLSKNKSHLLLNKGDSLVLSKAFARLYRPLSHELQKIMADLPNDIDSYKEDLEYMRQEIKEQENCEHKYGKPTNTLRGYGMQCTKCQYFERLKNTIRL